MITVELKVPKVRFIERGGPTLMDTVGRNNPNAKEWYCHRQEEQKDTKCLRGIKRTKRHFLAAQVKG